MSFTSQKYKKYFTLNHNGPKNVRTVQTIASIGVEMMPAGTDVGYGWVYINKVGLRCITRSLAVPPAGAKMPQKVLSLFRSPPYAAVRVGWMLPRAHSPVSAAIKRCARLLWMPPSLIATLTA